MIPSIYSFSFSGKPLVFNSLLCEPYLIERMILLRLITCSISMERWKFVFPHLGTCKVVIGIVNKKAMDLEFRKLPVKLFCFLVFY